MRIAPEDGARVSAAVKAAEAMTDGEVAVIAAERSDDYEDVALHWAIFATFLLLAVVAAMPGRVVAVIDGLTGSWGEAWSARALLTFLLVASMAAFLLSGVLLRSMPLRLALVPRARKAERVRKRALEHFRAGIEARTATRTGVLLYLSLAERQAEIVADRAIAAKVAPEAWGDAMTELVNAMKDDRPGDGIVAAVARIGTILGAHFPFTGTDPNELPDGLILL